MSHPGRRRLLALGALGACLTGLAAPATAADQDTVVVEALAAAGARTFFVAPEGTDDSPGTLERLTFSSSGEQQFRVVVKDVNRTLDTGFEVSASMSNLYFKNTDGSYDSEWTIPSRNLGLKFRATNPVQAFGVQTPVKPQLSVTGTLADCLDPAMQTTLGITTSSGGVLGGVLDPLEDLIDGLTEPLALVCEGLGENGLTVATTVVDDTLATLPLSAATDLLALPVGLLGGQQAGSFDNPAYQGIGAGRGPASPPAATTKRVLAGTPLATAGLLTKVNASLTSVVGTGGGLLSESELIAALTTVSPTLGEGLNKLKLTEPAKVTNFLTAVSASLVPLTGDPLSTVTGSYVAHPVLTANTTAAKPGTYEGTLIVDFIDGVKPL